MANKAIHQARLGDISNMAGLSIKEANKASIAALLLSIRERVMQNAGSLTAESPPALGFDPRRQSLRAQKDGMETVRG